MSSRNRSSNRSIVVLGADTARRSGRRGVFGKPRESRGLRSRCSREACPVAIRTRVLTGVALQFGIQGDVRTALSITEVRFREISPDEALAYWQSGEPCDKAGAYAIQGLGGVFVKAISGSYSGVVGLPVFETARLLRDAGLRVLND